MSLNDLLEKIESATEGSHDLDAAIYSWWRKVTPPPALGVIWSCDDEYAPAYTTSLDAMRSLFPSGTLWAMVHMEDGPLVRLCVPNKDGNYTGGYIEARANTVELAGCIAALRAPGRPGRRGRAGRPPTGMKGTSDGRP